MSAIGSELKINSRTTGFASPAEAYVNKRLDLNELIITNTYSTFFFRYMGEDILGVKGGSILVIDKSIEPVEGDLVVLTEETTFKIREFRGQENLWGRIAWILSKQ